MTRPHIIRKQRQLRRAKVIRRVEFVLSVDADRDQKIIDFIDDLPHGAAAEFIRCAIHEKMQREQGEIEPPERQHYAPPPAQSEASAQFEALMHELAAQRREIAELREAVAAPVMVTAAPEPLTDRRRRMEPEARSAPTPQPEFASSSTGEVVSSGIDMSRPRHRKTQHSSTPTPQTNAPAPELDERAQAALARELIRSIGAFGQDR